MKNKLKIDLRKNLSVKEQFKINLKNYLAMKDQDSEAKVISAALAASLFNVDVSLAQEVYQDLVNENFFSQKEENFYKIKPYNAIYENETQDISLTQLAQKMGLETSCKIVSTAWVKHFKPLKIDKELLVGRYYKVIRVNYFGKEKEALIIAYIHESLINEDSLIEIERLGFSNIMNQLMDSNFDRRRVLSIINAHQEVVDLLELDKNQAVIFSHQTIHDKDNILLFYLDFYTTHEAFLTHEIVDYKQRAV